MDLLSFCVEHKTLYEFNKDYDETYDFSMNNMVEQENTLIFGSIIDIFKFGFDTGEKFWYPLIDD